MPKSLPTSHVSPTEETEEGMDDLMASVPTLWMPRSVVKRNRRTATAIWIVMLVGFIAYIVYIVMDTVDARSNPASHVRIKQEPFKFPDIAICATAGEGCYTSGSVCFHPNISALWMVSQWGFLEDELELDDNSQLIEEEFPACKVLPLSKLTVNETGVNNGDIDYFSVQVMAIWNELWYNLTDVAVNTRFVRTFFIDVDADLEDIGEEVIDGDIPYDIISAEDGERFEVVSSNLLITMTEFKPIGSNGQELEKERTYTQRTTSTTMVWDWTGDSITELAFLHAVFTIPKFEFMSIEEVDPVDVWAIIGAIGGVWQIVCVGFGLFFVFSVKQAPDLKMRNFKKAARKPLVVGRRLTQSVSRQSEAQDVEIHADDEDLPEGWIKRQRPNGSVYYFHVLTGTSQDRCPNPTGAKLPGYGDIQPAHEARAGDGVNFAATHGTTADVGVRAGELPPGWLTKTDHEGRTYYVDTERKTTQWDPPVVGAPAPQATSGGGHRVMGSEPPQYLMQGAPVAGPPSKTDRSTSSSKRTANRGAPVVREMSRPRRRLVSQQGSESGDDTPGAIPAPSCPSGGRRGSSTASAGRRTGAHADPL